jgi:hypothetical protein
LNDFVHYHFDKHGFELGHTKIQIWTNPVGTRTAPTRSEVMEWFSQKTAIAGTQIPYWGIVLGAVVLVLLVLSFMH